MKGDKWKYARSKMAPAFATGKIRAMFPLILEVCEELKQNLQRRIDAKDSEFEAHNLCAEYTTDVVASCAFGIKSDSLRQPDNQFRKMGKELFEPGSFMRQMEIMVVFTLPKIAEFLGCKFISKRVEDFFRDLISKAFAYREKHAEFKRNDFINLLMQLKKLGAVDIEESDKKEMSASINKEVTEKGKIGDKSCVKINSTYLFYLNFQNLTTRF
jgi:cytochrome P450 family 6